MKRAALLALALLSSGPLCARCSSQVRVATAAQGPAEGMPYWDHACEDDTEGRHGYAVNGSPASCEQLAIGAYCDVPSVALHCPVSCGGCTDIPVEDMSSACAACCRRGPAATARRPRGCC